MRSIPPFEVFLTGTLCFLAGLLFALVMQAEGWARQTVGFAVFGTAFLAIGAWRLRALYRAQR